MKWLLAVLAGFFLLLALLILVWIFAVPGVPVGQRATPVVVPMPQIRINVNERMQPIGGRPVVAEVSSEDMNPMSDQTNRHYPNIEVPLPPGYHGEGPPPFPPGYYSVPAPIQSSVMRWKLMLIFVTVVFLAIAWSVVFRLGRRRRGGSAGFGGDDQAQMDRLMAGLDKMEHRMDNVETIFDARNEAGPLNPGGLGGH
jgi:phage shock protein B